jgi:beta-galactosidase
MAEESSNGINLYESYLRLKALEQKRPVIYLEAAGEWNSD